MIVVRLNIDKYATSFIHSHTQKVNRIQLKNCSPQVGRIQRAVERSSQVKPCYAQHSRRTFHFSVDSGEQTAQSTLGSLAQRRRSSTGEWGSCLSMSWSARRRPLPGSRQEDGRECAYRSARSIRKAWDEPLSNSAQIQFQNIIYCMTFYLYRLYIMRLVKFSRRRIM